MKRSTRKPQAPHYRLEVPLAEDFLAPTDRLAPHRQPGAAPDLVWLLIGAIFVILGAFALPDLIAWAHTWSAP